MRSVRRGVRRWLARAALGGALAATLAGCGGTSAVAHDDGASQPTSERVPWERAAFALAMPDGVRLELRSDGAILRDGGQVASLRDDGRVVDLTGRTLAALLADGQISFRGALQPSRIHGAIPSVLAGARQTVLRDASSDLAVLEGDTLRIDPRPGWPSGTGTVTWPDGAAELARPLVVLLAALDVLDHPRPARDAMPSLEAPPDVAAPPAHATRTPSGLAYVVIVPGYGTEHPRPDSRVRVHYTGWSTDGVVFDSSVSRGQPATFPLSGVIRGWTEGVGYMVEGERARFWMPPDLAYGDTARHGVPTGTLVFDIELLDIVE